VLLPVQFLSVSVGGHFVCGCDWVRCVLCRADTAVSDHCRALFGCTAVLVELGSPKWVSDDPAGKDALKAKDLRWGQPRTVLVAFKRQPSSTALRILITPVPNVPHPSKRMRLKPDSAQQVAARAHGSTRG